MQTYHLSRRPLFVLGDFNNPVSYNYLARMIVTALVRAKMPLAIDSRCNLGELCPPWFKQLEAPSGRNDWKLWVYPVCQLHETAEHINPQYPLTIDKRTIVFTMWEAAYLRPEWVELLNRAALILVPCEWNRTTFIGNGVKVPIRVVPLGCNTHVYKNKIDTLAPNEITFGTAGALTGGGWRKNFNLVLAAFQQAFPVERDVRLRIKVTPFCVRHIASDKDGNLKFVEAKLKMTEEQLVDDRIDVIADFIDDEPMAQWYQSLDAFVSASSGEGFGLHLLEAMACGVPLISTDYSGVSEFFSGEDVGYPVEYRLQRIQENPVYDGVWAMPTVESLAARMRDVYNNDRVEGCRRGQQAFRKGQRAAQVASLFTWDQVGERLKWELSKKMAA